MAKVAGVPDAYVKQDSCEAHGELFCQEAGDGEWYDIDGVQSLAEREQDAVKWSYVVLGEDVAETGLVEDAWNWR